MIPYSKAYFNQKIVNFNDATLSIASSSILYGLSTYTVIPIYLTLDKKSLNIFRLSDHYKRLVESSTILNFNHFLKEYNYAKFEKIILELIKENKIKSDSLIRVSVYVDDTLSGAKSIGLKNNLSVFIYPAHKLIDKPGADLMVSSFRRTPDNSIPSRAKVNGGYVNSALAKNEAILNGYDDAIFLDQEGHVSESTVSNIFIVRNKTIITPGNSSDLLEGITRDTILNIAQTLKIPTRQRSLDRTELYLANEAFLSGSSLMIFPIFKIDHVIINQSKIGPITQKITNLYWSIVRSKDNNDWLKKVNILK